MRKRKCGRCFQGSCKQAQISRATTATVETHVKDNAERGVYRPEL
jgi:hypothetical protein